MKDSAKVAAVRVTVGLIFQRLADYLIEAVLVSNVSNSPLISYFTSGLLMQISIMLFLNPKK